MTKATRLYLVIDDGSGEASMFALARDEAHAIEQTKHILACEDGDTSFLRAVTADTATNEQTRATLALLGSLAEEATKSFSLECVNRELNELDALLPALTKLAQSIAAERAAAQAALPVLRWREMRTGRHLGNLGDWRVDAYDSEVVLFYRGVEVGIARANSLDEAKSKGAALLRSAHVAFVVDGEVSR